MKFTEYNVLDLPEVNRRMLEKWQNDGLFEQSMKVREGAPSFVFYEGPPSANGMPGMLWRVLSKILFVATRP